MPRRKLGWVYGRLPEPADGGIRGVRPGVRESLLIRARKAERITAEEAERVIMTYTFH